MATNLQPITSDGGFTSGGNINSSGDSSLNDFFSITSAANFAIVTDNANTDQTWTFDDAGNLTLPGNTFAVNYANGTQVSIGGGSGNTGNVTFDDNIVIGTGDEFGSTGLFLAPGIGSIANSAVQYLRVRGGDAPTHIHLDTGNNAFYDQYFGNDAKYVKLEAGDTGNVVIGTDDANGNQYNWSFTSDGNLILAGGNSVIQSIANSSSEPLYPNVSTMVFTPDAFLSSQSLVLDPTGPSHIHLRAPGANIDEPDANIFLGGETSSFEVGYYNGAAPNLFIHSNNNTWTFDTTGILAFPRDTDPNVADPILTIVGGANPSISAIDASLAGPANLGISALTTIFTGFTGDAIKIYPDDGEIGSTANLQIWANSGGNTEYSWTFDTTGNLTTPSNLVIGPGPGSGSSIFQYNEGLQILGEGANSVVQLGWTANTSAPGSVTTIAMNYPGGGEGNVLIAVGNNATTVNYWLFDNTGNATFPANGTTALHNITGNGLALFGQVHIGGNLNYAEDANLIVVEDKNSFADIIAQNKNSGGNASMNIVLVNDDPGNVYMAVGVNSSNFTPFYNTLFEIPDAGYVSHSATQVMGPQSAESGESRMFFTYSSGSYALELNEHGAIGWGASYNGNLTQGNFGNVGQVLTSAGENSAPSWTNIPAPTVSQDITSNGAMSIMLYDGNIKYNNYATVEPSTGNIAGGNISTTGVVTANTANITTGNITTINSGLLQNGNSNITITSNGNVSIQAAGSNVELVVTSTGANVNGTLDVTGNITGANLVAGSGGLGNVYAGNVIINGQPTTYGVANLTTGVVAIQATATGTVTATVVANTSPNLSSFSNGNSTSPATTVFTLSIPSAGTWQLESWIRTFSTTGTPLISGGFYTGGTLVANSETLLWPSPVTNANGAGYMSAVVTTTGAATYTVGLWTTGTGVGLFSDSAGRTKAQATQISSIFALNTLDTMTTTGNVSVGGNISATGVVTANTANITTGNITTINSGLLQNGNSNITITSNGNVSIQAAGSNVELVVTSTGANVTGTLTSTGKIGYASGSTVTQTTNRGNGVTINALAGTIITTSASMVANQIDTFSVANDQVDTNNDIVLVQVVSPNLGNYNVIANPNSGIGGFYLTLQNISGFPISAEAVTIRFMVIKAPNA
jgi:hypothetical protein